MKPHNPQTSSVRFTIVAATGCILLVSLAYCGRAGIALARASLGGNRRAAAEHTPRARRMKETARLNAPGASVRASNPSNSRSLGPTTRAQFAQNYGKLPLSFEPNRGQTDPQVKFLARGRGYTLFMTSREAVMVVQRGGAQSKRENTKVDKTPGDGLRRLATDEPLLPTSLGAFQFLRGGLESAGSGEHRDSESLDRSSVLRIELVGGNPASHISGTEELPSKSNYFIGNDPDRWSTSIPAYAKVECQQVYPGVDLVYHGKQGQLELDFVLAPGADPEAIALKIRGSQAIEIDSRGDLRLSMEGGEVRLHSPQLYQQSGNTRHNVAGSYVLAHEDEVHFQVAAYDRRRPLVIDPVLTYSTYLGGSNADFAQAVAVDSAGNAYVTGQTTSVNFPTANGFQANLRGSSEAFVAKIDAGGNTLVYSTYLGGTFADAGVGIAVDDSGNAYVTGSTLSPDFPLLNPIQSVCKGCSIGLGNAFVTKIGAGGSTVVYSTFLGGSQGNTPGGIALDSSGDAYVAGTTSSTDFPTANPIQAILKGASDAFVSKVNAAGSQLLYSTFLGGSRTDSAEAIAVDSSGNAFITGTTTSVDFPAVNALQATCRACGAGQKSPFVTKINAAGSALVYSTYFGGSSGVDAAQAIAVDSSGNAYVTGHTGSSDFPTANPFQAVRQGTSDAFVSKINASGSGLIYSTYLGGGNAENLAKGSIAVDAFGNAYVTGDTASANFPTADPFMGTLQGPVDAFVSMFNAPGSVLFFSTYLGGSGSDEGRAIAVDTSGNAIVVGSTNSPNFPTANPRQGACNQCSGTSTDAFLTKISGRAFSLGPASGSSNSATVTAGQSAVYNLTLVPSGGFNGTVSLSCSGAPAAATCSMSPASIVLSSSNPSAFTATVSTTSRALVQHLPPWNPPVFLARAMDAFPWLLCLLAAAIALGRAAGKRRPAGLALALTMLLLLVVLLAACGSGPASPPSPSSGTPRGTYTLNVIGASGSLNNSVTLVLNVN